MFIRDTRVNELQATIYLLQIELLSIKREIIACSELLTYNLKVHEMA